MCEPIWVWAAGEEQPVNVVHLSRYTRVVHLYIDWYFPPAGGMLFGVSGLLLLLLLLFAGGLGFEFCMFIISCGRAHRSEWPFVFGRFLL